MKCPKCDSSLIKVTIKTRPEYGGEILKDAEKIQLIQVDQCLSCNGIWFDAFELEQYLAEKLIILDSPKIKHVRKFDKKIGRCPKCGIDMKKEQYKNITIDICIKCNGVWLDSAELDKLEDKNISFLEKNRLILDSIFEYIKQLIASRKGRK